MQETGSFWFATEYHLGAYQHEAYQSDQDQKSSHFDYLICLGSLTQCCLVITQKTSFRSPSFLITAIYCVRPLPLSCAANYIRTKC